MPRPSPMCAAAIAAAFVLLSAGCQQTKLGATWQSEEFGQGTYQRVMILGLTENAKNRRVFEYELAVQLQRIDVETIPSLELLSPKDKPVRDVIQPILLENGIDGILVVRPTGSETGGPRTVRIWRRSSSRRRRSRAWSADPEGAAPHRAMAGAGQRLCHAGGRERRLLASPGGGVLARVSEDLEGPVG